MILGSLPPCTGVKALRKELLARQKVAGSEKEALFVLSGALLHNSLILARRPALELSANRPEQAGCFALISVIVAARHKQ
jgi:hypothetical protein